MRDEVPRMQAGGEGWRVTPARKPGPSFLTLRGRPCLRCTPVWKITLVDDTRTEACVCTPYFPRVLMLYEGGSGRTSAGKRDDKNFSGHGILPKKKQLSLSRFMVYCASNERRRPYG